MSWNKVVLTTAQIEEQHALEKLQKQFEKLYISADGPDEMALFSDHEYKAAAEYRKVSSRARILAIDGVSG